MYETILGKIDALSASLGLIRKSQQIQPGENPWNYAGGARSEISRNGEKSEGQPGTGTNSDSESFESSFTMVEKAKLRRAS